MCSVSQAGLIWAWSTSLLRLQRGPKLPVKVPFCAPGMPCLTTASLPVLGSLLQLASDLVSDLSLVLPLLIHSCHVWAYVAYEIAHGSLLLPVLSCPLSRSAQSWPGRECRLPFAGSSWSSGEGREVNRK